MLQALNIHFARDGNPILTDINLALSKGEFIGLIGPNGAGKSSLLRILAGLCAPDRGEILIESATGLQPLDLLTPQNRARHMAYLAQQETPAWPLAVKHLIGLGRAPWRRPFEKHSEDDAAITRALALTELTELQDRAITSLSGGELQRALLARVFAGEPQLIIADEPTAALDPYHQLHMMELLRSHATQGGTVIAALHDLSLAARYCQRLILLHNGRVCVSGTPSEVLTADNLQSVYGITAYVECREDGVVIIPKGRKRHPLTDLR